MELINHQLERSVLGAVINNDLLYIKLVDKLNQDLFDCHVNKQLFNCIKQEYDNHGFISKAKLLHRFTDVKGITGQELETNFVEICSNAANPFTLNASIKTLHDLKQKRDIRSLFSTINLKLNDYSSEDLTSQALSELIKIISSGNVDNSTTIAQEFEELYNQIKDGKEPDVSPTGLEMLDVAMGGGLQRGRVYSFIAKSKCGKTMLATTVSNSLCDTKKKHAFICAEMGSREVSLRMLCQRLKIPTKALRGAKNANKLYSIAEEIKKVKNYVIFENEPAIDFNVLKAVIEKHVYKNKIEGFILDYYQLVTGIKSGQTQAQHLEEVANWIHKVCKKHNIWCFLLVQANDDGQVLGSRGIDRACDQKYMIERPLDDTGDPIGNQAWLKMKLSRYTKLYNLGSKNNPTLVIHENGTHIEAHSMNELV